MSLSARRLKRRPVRVRAVGLPTRLLSAILDSILPTLALIAMMATGALDLEAYRLDDGFFAVDQILMRLFRQPGDLLVVPLCWMCLWTVFSLVTLATVQTTLGKRIMRLKVRDSSGSPASGMRLLLRVSAAWLIPATLGLAYLWIVISPERRAWHDLMSGTFVVRDQAELGPVAPRSPRV